uniref:Uncharacterized protein n=1 Tax=Candidatus Kentrum sp. TUN TaxID=2126343 RepID=A0A450ZR56_9GAMM|nr:MAG: hypothetical protein BECKTUN1418F_GA0071002_10392 [Candidatus Kentron sp. TUN]VFK56315.1 MAG: hypothetical protein BECKTUN1418E_GA0071001_10402 [Candidatus Kentron sp. TUN]
MGEFEGTLPPDVSGLAEIEGRQQAGYALLRAFGKGVQILGEFTLLAAFLDGLDGGGAPIAVPDGQGDLLQDTGELVFIEFPCPGMLATAFPLPFIDGFQEVGIDLVQGRLPAEIEFPAAVTQGHQVIQ